MYFSLQFEFISSYYWIQCELLVLLRKFGALKKSQILTEPKLKVASSLSSFHILNVLDQDIPKREGKQ